MATLVRLIHADPDTYIPTPSPPEGESSKFSKPSKDAKPIRDKVPQSTIDKLKKLRDPERKRMFEAILSGESFADPGNRDTAMQRVASSLVWADEGKTTVDGLAELLRPSLQIWADEPDAILDVEEELDKIKDKLSRASGDFKEQKGEELARLEGLRNALVKDADPDFKHLALQQDNTYYVYSFDDEEYWPACTSKELPLIIRDAWPEGTPVELSYLTAKGETKKKTTTQLLDEYGTVVREVVHSMSLGSSSYNPATKVLHVPTALRRSLEPEFYPEIDEWLSLLPKHQKHLPMLLDWIATCMDLTRMSAAIYLSGPKGTGKSLLSTGLARLWSGGGPSKLEHVFHRFNDTILRCPFIVLDESWKGDNNINLCAQLRELVGNMSHQIEQKGKPVVTAEGSVRLMITTNNETTLNVRGNGDQNQMERDATIERILHVPTSIKASKFIVKIKDRDTWRTENKIAKHALWLRDQRAAEVIEKAKNEGHRFLIQGDETDAEFYDGIGSRPKDHDAALQWLSCVFTRAPLPSIRDKISVHPGDFRVVPRALCDSWESWGLSKNFETPTSSHRAKGILKPFLLSDTRVSLNGAKAYHINIERFVRISKEEGIISPKVLEERLGIKP